jgi:hypothetical protein
MNLYECTFCEKGLGLLLNNFEKEKGNLFECVELFNLYKTFLNKTFNARRKCMFGRLKIGDLECLREDLERRINNKTGFKDIQVSIQ